MSQNFATHVTGRILYNTTLEKFVAALRESLRKKNREMFVAGYVTLGNFSRNVLASQIYTRIAITYVNMEGKVSIPSFFKVISILLYGYSKWFSAIRARVLSGLSLFYETFFFTW